ncbi:MAG: hypothetical protein M9897_07565 [Brumimicrobium sp.]|nr:hypothetical protein [Crocinitomicaceae bacterium]MCO5268736.1 hypothetical protein [Brumimicrobium sp.]
MGRIWNGENAKLKLDELYVLSDGERIKQAQMIRTDLKAWALENFCFSDLQKRCLESISETYLEEVGQMIARAIEKRYPIELAVTDDTLPVAQRVRKGGVDVGWSKDGGFYIRIWFEW